MLLHVLRPPMRALPLLICVALSGCATRWVNAVNPAANLEGDAALCEKDAKRVAQLDGMIGQPSRCSESSLCVTAREQQELRSTAHANLAVKRCMAARGWQQQY